MAQCITVRAICKSLNVIRNIGHLRSADKNPNLKNHVLKRPM